MGGDRASLSLDDGGPANNQNALISAVATANPNTIVVVSTPGAILMPWSTEVKSITSITTPNPKPDPDPNWSPEVKSILINFMPGQQAGNAVADVIFGAVNPSGKLPLTMPNKENEMEFTPAQWPGLPDPTKPAYANYSEVLRLGLGVE